jgi:Flp pilus assembly protein TadG
MTSRHGRERGTQLVEFAVILPAIILFSLLAAEGANLFRVYAVVANASREGARVATLAWYSPAAMSQNAQTTCSFTSGSLTSANAVCQDVANYAQNNGLIGSGLQQCSTLTVEVNQAYQAPSDSVPRYSLIRVTCAYQLRWLPRLPFYTIATSLNITRSTAFLNFY